jgi:hypothetical protein
MRSVAAMLRAERISAFGPHAEREFIKFIAKNSLDASVLTRFSGNRYVLAFPANEV